MRSLVGRLLNHDVTMVQGLCSWHHIISPMLVTNILCSCCIYDKIEGLEIK